MLALEKRQLTIDQILAASNTLDSKNSLTLGGLLYQAGVNLGICAGLLLLFCILRPTNGVVYGRRVKHAPPEFRPPRLSLNPLSWIVPIVRVSEDDMLRTVGLDAVLLMRFLKLCFYTFLVFSAAGAGSLLPINYLYGVIPAGEKLGLDTIITRLNMENVTTLQWITSHVVVTYAISVFLWLVVFLNNRFFIRKRQEHFHSETYQTAIHNRTIIVTRLPSSLRDDESLADYMRRLTPGSRVTHASVGRELGDLPKLVAQHTEMINRLERVLASYLRDEASLDKPRPTIKVKKQPVDAIAYYTEQLEDIEQSIKAQRSNLHLSAPTSYAFVAYASAYDAHTALKTLRKSGTGNQKFLINAAPAPRDIIWPNLVLTPAATGSRKTLIRVLFTLFCCFATIPTSLLSLITSVSSLRQLFPETQPWFDANPKLASFWQTLITPFFLAVYFMMLPFFFRLMARYQGIHTKTAVERSMMKKTYIFLMFSQVVVFTITSVLTQLIGQVNNKELTVGQLFENLAPNIIKSLSVNSSFWISFVALRSVNNLLELAQPVSLFLIFTRRYFTKPTPRQVRSLSRPPDFDYGVVYANYLFLFVMTLLYSVYAPLIIPFGMVAFALGVIVFKYQLLYVYTTKVQTAGLMWRSVVNRIFFTMILFQIFVLLSLRFRIAQFKALGYMNQWALCIPLPILTLLIAVAHWFWLEPRMRYMQGPPTDDRFNDMTKENTNLGDRFLHHLFRESTTTPMVDKKVKHLLGKVYQGRRQSLSDIKNSTYGDRDGSSHVPGTNLRYDFRDMNSDTQSCVGDYSDCSTIYNPYPDEQHHNPAYPASGRGSEYEMNTLAAYPNGTMVDKYPGAGVGNGDNMGHPPAAYYDDRSAEYDQGYYQPYGHHTTQHHPQGTGGIGAGGYPAVGPGPTHMGGGPHNPYQPSDTMAPHDYPGQGFYTNPHSQPAQPHNYNHTTTTAHQSIYNDYFDDQDQMAYHNPSSVQPPPPTAAPVNRTNRSDDTPWKHQGSGFI